MAVASYDATVLPVGRRLGLHLPLASGMVRAIDRAHAIGATVDAFVDEFDERIGLERLVMIHLNDSKAERGSRLDRHEHLGAGRIGAAGLARVLTHPGLARTTYYLDTPGMDERYDAINTARAYDLAAGRPLATLPPEAMSVRGSRARTGPVEVVS
jgi:Xylose isomerase-like TIM barrel